jgi:cytochrome c oxidase assembly protein subunit 15
VQFIHRMTAYLLFAAAVAHVVDVIRTLKGGVAVNGALLLAGAITVQASIGVVTLLHHAPMSLALLHQGVAVVVLAIAVVHAERLVPRAEPRAMVAVPADGGAP